jgi:hypothetical protein
LSALRAGALQNTMSHFGIVGALLAIVLLIVLLGLLGVI